MSRSNKKSSGAIFGHVPVGAEVEVTLRGRAEPSLIGSMKLVSDQVGVVWVPMDHKEFRLVPAPHQKVKKGQVWSTRHGLYFVRVSRPDIQLRFTPDDMSVERGNELGYDEPLNTISEDEFFIKYPDAELWFNGNKPQRPKRPQSVNGQERVSQNGNS